MSVQLAVVFAPETPFLIQLQVMPELGVTHVEVNATFPPAAASVRFVVPAFAFAMQPVGVPVGGVTPDEAQTIDTPPDTAETVQPVGDPEQI